MQRAATAAGDRNVGILGDGVRMFDRPGGQQIQLEKTSVAESGQLTDLRFRVLK